MTTAEMKQFMETHNISVYNTGGNCLALTNNWDSGGFYWLITDANDLGLPESVNDSVCVGLYDDASGDMIAYWIYPDMFEAMAFINKTHLE